MRSVLLFFFYTHKDTYHCYIFFVLGYIFYHQIHIYSHMRYVLCVRPWFINLFDNLKYFPVYVLFFY